MSEKKHQSLPIRIPSFARAYKKPIALSCGVSVGLVVVGIGVALSVIPVEPTYQTNDQRVDRPIEIVFDQPTRAIDVARIAVSPQVAGRWSQQTSGLMAHKLIFTPDKDLKTSTTYTIRLPKVQRVLLGEISEKTIAITTEKAPSLAQNGVLFAKQDMVLAADATLSVHLTSKNRGLRELVLRTQPEITMEQTVQDDEVFSWWPKDILPQGQPLSIEIFDIKNNESLLKKTVAVAAEPHIVSPAVVGEIAPGGVVQVEFSEAIDTSSRDKIVFTTEGTGAWTNDKTYEFHPTVLQPGTRYDYMIKQGMRSQQGGIVREDKPLSFVTVGPVAVIGTSPSGGGLKQDQQVISVTFNRPVDKASAESRLRVSSGTVAGISWSGNTLRATVQNLGFQQRVTVTMLAGVQNTTFGLPTAQNYSFAFDTEVRTVRLNVPHYTQQQAATCTAASLRMMLAYRGIQTDEMSLVYKMGYAPREADRSTNPPTWDDPDQMFVGYTDGGSIWRGAGPDAPPVAKAARAYRGASNFTGVSAEWIAARIHEGNPVMMFGATRNTGFVTWQTTTGRTVRMNISSHATVVTGVVGEPYAPIGFWVNDPRGGVSYWSSAQVRTNIARDAYAQAVVVY